LARIADFEGANGLYADLRSGRVPDFSFVAPNQCNDQHGRGNSTPFCNFDPKSDGTQAGLNPALILVGDKAVEKLVSAIHHSPAWKRGHNAIVLLWDENDYSLAPNTNQVITIVDTNYGSGHRRSGRFYTHFSLLRTLEGGFELPCLNHACDASTVAMTDLFGER
jgi:hypothetical protein